MNKKIWTLIVMLTAITASTFADTNYGIKVGGVDVTSSNCLNVTGSNIKAYDTSKSYKVSYAPLTHTLTLDNVKIERTGSYNRAILNELKEDAILDIKFVTPCYLKAEDSSPVRLNRNTRVHVLPEASGTTIIGGSEDAVTIGEGKEVQILGGGTLIVKGGGSKSNSFEGATGNETLILQNITLECNNSISETDGYAFYNLAELVIRSCPKIYAYGLEQSVAAKIKAFTKDAQMFFKEDLSYSSDQQKFVRNSGSSSTVTVLTLAHGVPLNETNFPDAAFRTCLKNNVTAISNWRGQALIDIEEPNITSFYVQDDNVTNMKGIEHFQHLTSFTATCSALTTLDLSANTTLQKIVIRKSQLTSLNLRTLTALTKMELTNNSVLTTVTMPNTTDNQLQSILCTNNALTALSLTYLKKLETLTCCDNALTTLTVPATTTLTSILCYNNQLKSLNVSGATALKTLSCHDNQLTTLTIGALTSLESLACYKNKLSTLDLSKATGLVQLECYSNKIKGSNMTAMVNGLPIRSSNSNLKLVDHNDTGELNECTPSDVALAKSRGWTLQHRDGSMGQSFVDTEGCYMHQLWIRGQQMDSHHETGTGYNYYPDTKTLILNGAIFEGTGLGEEYGYGAGIYSNIDGLTIKVNGNCSAKAYSTGESGLYLCKSTTIIGTGSLTALGDAAGIYIEGGKLAIGDNVKVYADGSLKGVGGYYEYNSSTGANQYLSSLEVKDNATLKAYAGTSDTSVGHSAIEWLDNVTLLDNHAITEPAGAYWSNEAHAVLDADGKEIREQWVTIAVRTVIPGDANGDGKVNITDAVAIVDYILGNRMEGFNEAAADVNNDTKINITDAVAVVDIILAQ